MPAPATVDEFVDLVRKSNVLDEGRLAAYVQKIKADPTTPKALSGVAGLFVRDGLITYFQAEQFLQGKWKRFTIGKYKVLEKLGSGGMGQVFLCEHKLMRRRVAVKVLPTAKATDQSSLERFYREARAVAALDHPNIVRAYDIDQDDNLHFLVMEYVDGASFQDMIRKAGPMDVTRACHYMYWSAIGLQNAHENGLYHRDIKPGNILVDRQGVVKILDLGLARFFNDDEDMLTKKFDENVLGTADYLAPEQAIDSHSVDGRADIYSLGATFYFLLTGSPPFADGSVAQKLLWHQNRTPKPIREARPDVPPDVAFVLQKMMAKKAEDRYQTPAQLAEALLPFTQTPIPPPPDTEMPTLSAAAMGTATPAPVPATAPRTGPAPRTPAPTHRPPAPRTPAPVGLADADTRRTTGVPIVEPMPESAPGSAPIWEAISAETANATQTDTDRRKREPRSSRRTKGKPPADPAPAPAPKSKPRMTTKADSKVGLVGTVKGMSLPVLLATGVAALILMAAGGYAVYHFAFRGTTKPSTPATTGGGEARRLVVTKNAGGQPLHYLTAQAAVNAAQPGDQIVIADDEWEETTVNLTRTRNVTISTADGKKVKWRAAKDAPAVLALHNAEATRVTGIEFVAADRGDVAVRVSGKSGGLVLEDVDFTGGTTAGLELHQARGEKAKLTVRKARFQSGGRECKAAVLFTAEDTAGKGRPVSDEVAFHNCTVIGPYTDGGFVFDGGAVGVEVRHCRVWKSGVGLLFHRPRPEVTWTVAATGNTFYALAAGVRCDDLNAMKAKPEIKIRLTQNYFGNSPELIQYGMGGDPTGAIMFAGSEGNIRKQGTNPGPPNLLPTTEVAGPDLSETVGDPKFLTYDQSHPLFKGFAGKPVGVPPQ